MNAHLTTAGHGRTTATLSSTGSLPARICQAVLDWQTRVNERAALSRMDDRMLRDVGLTRADVDRESRRLF